MDVHLSAEQEALVGRALRSGAYSSPGDVIDRALETLRQQEEWLLSNREAIDAKIRRGIEQIQRGEGIPEDRLDGYLTRLKNQPE